MPSENNKPNIITVPDWVKPELFEQTLKDTVKDFKKIINFKVSPGTRPGDNYITIMLRVEVDIELKDKTKKSISYMLKTARKSAEYDEAFGRSEFNIFDTEREMFTNVVQEFKDMYKEVGLDVEFGAKCYKLNTKEDHILLEDLKAKGFRPTNRLAGLDKQHTLGVLKKLAQWHAASATRVAIKGHYPQNLQRGLFTEEGKVLIKSLSEGVIDTLLKSYATIEGHEEYSDAVKNMKANIFKNIWEVRKVDPNEFNVLNHNDCWLSNIMFQYNDQDQLLDTYLVDYQICKYGSVALDLLYFLISSPRLEIKIKEFDHFIKYYHDHLIEHLNLLKYPNKLPTLIEIHTQLLRYGVWGFNVTLGVMAGANLEDVDGADFDNLLADTPEGEKFRAQLYIGNQYKQHVKIVLPWLLNRGALYCPNIDNESK